jgi:hypothetical protein
MADRIRVNGNLQSWGSIVFKANGERFYGFTSISYGDSRERVKAWGMGKSHAPRGKSKGKYDTDNVVVSGWAGSVQELIDGLSELALDGVSYGDVEFEIQVQYVDSGEKPRNIELLECHIVKVSEGNEESADPLKTDFEVSCTRIKRNGKTLYDASEEGA